MGASRPLHTRCLARGDACTTREPTGDHSQRVEYAPTAFWIETHTSPHRSNQDYRTRANTRATLRPLPLVDPLFQENLPAGRWHNPILLPTLTSRERAWLHHGFPFSAGSASKLARFVSAASNTLAIVIKLRIPR